VFITWKGDPPPRHVHVYKDDTLVVKWNLDDGLPMKGEASSRLRKLMAELQDEGLL